jgi:hypothetical protein
VFIDFSGSFLVANFGTLLLTNRAQSVDKIKRRLWDLKVDRDKQQESMMISRTHEMIVQHPAPDDPQITERQARISVRHWTLWSSRRIRKNCG